MGMQFNHSAVVSVPKETPYNRALVLVVFLISITLASSSHAQTFSVLYNFSGADGAGPSGNLIRDTAGTIYGTTFIGGTSNLGTIFKLDATGVETVLYSFSGGTDGGNPNPGLIRDAAGNLYGTNQQDSGFISGTAFRIDATGTKTVLHTFGSGTDGQYPRAGLVRDSNGNLYGTAAGGGTLGKGIIYKLDATGAETILYNFPGGLGGEGPTSPLIRDSAGNLYGTTVQGGHGLNCACGIAFKVDTSGIETVLYNFTDARPSLGLTRDFAGNLFGTTVQGGPKSVYCISGCGRVFKLNSGTATTLYTFSGKADGRYPLTTLIRDSAGSLYGTTEEGGTFNLGTVFKVGPQGRETVLHSFSGTDGSTPYGSLTLDLEGNLYGATLNGGAFGLGTIFKITP